MDVGRNLPLPGPPASTEGQPDKKKHIRTKKIIAAGQKNKHIRTKKTKAAEQTKLIYFVCPHVFFLSTCVFFCPGFGRRRR